MSTELPVRGWQEGRGPLIGVVALALLLRLAFVLWAPGGLSSDAFFYHHYGQAIANGLGYTSLDGSPGILWMPGWPIFLAGLQLVFGPSVRAAMIVNAFLGAATAGLVVTLGDRLFDRRIGLGAGLLYAIWPGNIYYSAVLMTEVFFCFLLAAFLHVLSRAATVEGRGRVWIFAAAGGLLGGAAMVKAEPLVLIPVGIGLAWTLDRGLRRFATHSACLLVVTAVVLLPWTVRNYVHFDRFLPLSGGGGMNLWQGNHPGASGDRDMLGIIRHQRPFKNENLADRILLSGDVMRAEAWEFVRSQPLELLQGVGRKLVLTYASDSDGATQVRGVVGKRQALHFVPVPPGGYLSMETRDRLARIADVFWFGVMALAGIGLLTLRSWSRPALVLVLGPVAMWLGVHAFTMGNPRFHVPEELAYALLAAHGGRLLWRAGGRPWVSAP